jgi:hypothetical protein
MQSLKRVEILSDLKTVALTDGTERLLAPYYVRLDDDYLCIPEGFVTDLASVPRIPVIYLWLGGRGKKAAVVHDWLYATGFYPQSKCDGYFYLLLREIGVDWFSARGFLHGLQIGGFKAYNEYELKRKDQAKLNPPV